MSPSVDRLVRWRDVGDDPDAGYAAGNRAFAEDVKALLAEREGLLRVAAAANALRSMFHNSALVGEELEAAEQPFKDLLDERLEALPEEVRKSFDEEPAPCGNAETECLDCYGLGVCGAPNCAPPLRFRYRNWRGAEGDRKAVPRRIFYGSTEHHPEPQWLLEAWDVEKQAIRVFAVVDMAPIGV